MKIIKNLLFLFVFFFCLFLCSCGNEEDSSSNTSTIEEEPDSGTSPIELNFNKCGEKQNAGNIQPEIRMFNMGRPSGIFEFWYETYTLKDQIILLYERAIPNEVKLHIQSNTVTEDDIKMVINNLNDGDILFDTTCVGTNDEPSSRQSRITVFIEYTGKYSNIAEVVYPNCANEGTSTEWKAQIQCPAIYTITFKARKPTSENDPGESGIILENKNNFPTLQYFRYQPENKISSVCEESPSYFNKDIFNNLNDISLKVLLRQDLYSNVIQEMNSDKWNNTQNKFSYCGDFNDKSFIMALAKFADLDITTDLNEGINNFSQFESTYEYLKRLYQDNSNDVFLEK